MTFHEDLADDLMEVLNTYRTKETLTYATVLGILDIIKDTLLEELRNECHDQDFDCTPIFQDVTKPSN